MDVNDSTAVEGTEEVVCVPVITTPPAARTKAASSRDRNKIYVGIEKTLSPLKIFEQERQPCCINDLYHKDVEEEEETRLCSDNKSPVSVTDAIAYQESTNIQTSKEDVKGSSNNLLVYNSDQTTQNNGNSSKIVLSRSSSPIVSVSSSSLPLTPDVNNVSTSLLVSSSPEEESTTTTTSSVSSGTHHKRTLTDCSGIVDVLPAIPESKEIKHVNVIAVAPANNKENEVTQEEKNVSSASSNNSDMIPLTSILPIINATNTITDNLPDSSLLSGSGGAGEAMILQSAIITSSNDKDEIGGDNKKFVNLDNKGNLNTTSKPSSNYVTLLTTAASNNMSTTPICMPTPHVKKITSSSVENNNNQTTTASASQASKPSSSRYYQRKYFPSPRRLCNSNQEDEEEEVLPLSLTKSTPSNDNHVSVIDGRPFSTPSITTKTTSNQKGEVQVPVPVPFLSSSSDKEETTSKSAFLHRRVNSLPLSYVPSNNISCMSQNTSDIVLNHSYYEHQLQQQLKETIKKYGEYHIHVAKLCSKLGTLYFRNGQYINASKQYKRSLHIIQILKETTQKEKGVTGKRLLALWQNLSRGNNILVNNQDILKKKQLLLTRLECIVCTNYGTTLWHLQQPAKSIQYFERVYNVYCYPRTIDRGNAAHNLGSAYLMTLLQQQNNNNFCNDDACNDYDNTNVTRTIMIGKAESLLHEALMMRVQFHKHNIIDVARTMDMLSTLYGCIIKQYDKAVMWSFKSYHMKQKELLAQSCSNHNDNNTKILKESLQATMTNISNICYRMERYREAFEINDNRIYIYQTYHKLR